MRLKINKDPEMQEEIPVGIFKLLGWKSTWSRVGKILGVAHRASVAEGLQTGALFYILFCLVPCMIQYGPASLDLGGDTYCGVIVVSVIIV